MRKIILARCLALYSASAWLAAFSSIALADSPDITEFMNPAITKVCPGFSLGVFVDSNRNGTTNLLVVFHTVQGEAWPEVTGAGAFPHYGLTDYFFGGANVRCPDGIAPVKIAVWFVDAQAPGFNPNVPSTWVYTTVPGVQLIAHSNPNVYGVRQINAYTGRFQGGTLVGSYTKIDPGGPYGDQICDFNSAQGIAEIYLRSDWDENVLWSFIVRSSSSGASSDAGLRVFDGTTTNRIACEFPIGTNALTSPIQFRKNGTNYGVILTDTNSPNASKIRIQTSSGTKAWAKLP